MKPETTTKLQLMFALKFFSHLTTCFLATQFDIPENINFYGVHDFLNNFHSNYHL